MWRNVASKRPSAHWNQTWSLGTSFLMTRSPPEKRMSVRPPPERPSRRRPMTFQASGSCRSLQYQAATFCKSSPEVSSAVAAKLAAASGLSSSSDSSALVRFLEMEINPASTNRAYLTASEVFSLSVTESSPESQAAAAHFNLEAISWLRSSSSSGTLIKSLTAFAVSSSPSSAFSSVVSLPLFTNFKSSQKSLFSTSPILLMDWTSTLVPVSRPRSTRGFASAKLMASSANCRSTDSL
mmetsp:Transcript_26054/g.61011  ORF Transcript_26054/g.61011 Transcript_26054/m.61011 type:complete len:239 (+) Transcript_26054:688-1404(+)